MLGNNVVLWCSLVINKSFVYVELMHISKYYVLVEPQALIQDRGKCIHVFYVR
jgi:hypothetical protein